MNRQYSREDYEKLTSEIRDAIRQAGLEFHFFPPSFAPCPYDESLAGFVFPKTVDEQQRAGFRTGMHSRTPPPNVKSRNDIVDDSRMDTPHSHTYWDEIAMRPFQILEPDISFARKMGVALPDCYYAERIKKLFRWMPFTGALRETKCAHTGASIQTHWASEYDGRILSETAYLEHIK